MEIDLVTAVQLAGLALTTETLRRLRAEGHPDLRTAHGYLIQHVVEGPRPVGEIAARMRVTQQAVSKSVGELVGLGYLERAPALDDARVRLIGLSEHGRAAVAATRRIRAEIEAELSATLGPDRASVLHDAALAALEWAGGGDSMRARQVPEPT
jgi:DNA-binding MarR family transcriptional regulator